MGFVRSLALPLALPAHDARTAPTRAAVPFSRTRTHAVLGSREVLTRSDSGGRGSRGSDARGDAPPSCTHPRTHTNAHAHTHTPRTHACTHTHTHTHIHTTHTQIHTHTGRTHTPHTLTHAHTHTHTHTHTHPRARARAARTAQVTPQLADLEASRVSLAADIELLQVLVHTRPKRESLAGRPKRARLSRVSCEKNPAFVHSCACGAHACSRASTCVRSTVRLSSVREIAPLCRGNSRLKSPLSYPPPLPSPPFPHSPVPPFPAPRRQVCLFGQPVRLSRMLLPGTQWCSGYAVGSF
jgi:hypothetical protein